MAEKQDKGSTEMILILGTAAASGFHSVRSQSSTRQGSSFLFSIFYYYEE